MSYKSYRNKVKNLVGIAALLVIIAAIDSIYIPTNHYTAQGQTSSQTNNNNATTQVQVGGGNATYPFFGYDPQTIQSSVGSKAVWTTPSLDFAEHIDQGNLCLKAAVKCSNSNVGEQTLGNDNSITGFSDQSKNAQVIITPTPLTATRTPIPGACPTNTVLDVTLQAAIDGLPSGTIFCLTVGLGTNRGVTAIIPPPGGTITIPTVLVYNLPITRTCPPGTTLALISSVPANGIPLGIPSTATAVCLHIVSGLQTD
jgi:hypothetical protein